ncbi:hypothetical protein BGZ63DRAFT_432396 [Mariannaea sp. PMI_226]|nr:hypothetical protein BGZ63DRAFT_432396 [Mariannaea sp. PMI_226]
MRAFFRKKRSAVSSADASPKGELQPQSTLMGKFRSKPELEKRKTKQNKLVGRVQDNGGNEGEISPATATFIVPTITASRSDPFHALPIKLGLSQEHLLKSIYATSYMQNAMVLNPEASQLSYAITDAALLHGLFSLASLHNDLRNGTNISPLCFMHRGEALRIVNERIAKAPLQLTDGTIGAVAALATFDTADPEMLVGIFKDLSKWFFREVVYKNLASKPRTPVDLGCCKGLFVGKMLVLCGYSVLIRTKVRPLFRSFHQRETTVPCNGFQLACIEVPFTEGVYISKYRICIWNHLGTLGLPFSPQYLALATSGV